MQTLTEDLMNGLETSSGMWMPRATTRTPFELAVHSGEEGTETTVRADSIEGVGDWLYGEYVLRGLSEHRDRARADLNFFFDEEDLPALLRFMVQNGWVGALNDEGYRALLEAYHATSEPVSGGMSVFNNRIAEAMMEALMGFSNEYRVACRRLAQSMYAADVSVCIGEFIRMRVRRLMLP